MIGGENNSYFGEGTSAYSSIFKYQKNYKKGSNLSFISTNRFFEKKGWGHVFGLSGLWRFGKSLTAELEVNKSLTKEPITNWISSDDIIKNKTVALDGERMNGNALYFTFERNTKNWNSSLEYSQYSPLYQTPHGFVTQNNIRFIEIEQGYQQFFKEDDFIRQMNIGLGSEFRFNFQGLKKYSDINTNAYFQFQNNIQSNLNYTYVINEEFEGLNAKGLHLIELFTSYNPSEKIRLGVFTSLGQRIRYHKDLPAIGNQWFIGTLNNFQVSPKLRISPSFRYSHLRNKIDDSYYFKGYIGRLNMNYQFNESLSIRLIAEYDDFETTFFYQPLLKWNPNPFTIFYIGGTNGYSKSKNNSRLSIDNSQIYMKFQYLLSM